MPKSDRSVFDEYYLSEENRKYEKNKQDCASREDSDKPRYQLSLVRVFAVHMKYKSFGPLLPTERKAIILISLGGCSG